MTTPSARRRTRAIGLLVSAVLLLSAGCGGEDQDAGDPETPTEIGEGISIENPELTTTTLEPAAPSTTAHPPPVGRPEPADAARFLYDAWGLDDRALALTVAEPEAVDAMFEAPPGPYELYRGCDAGEFDTGGCMFRDRTTNNTLQVNLERRADQWVVTGVIFSAG